MKILTRVAQVTHSNTTTRRVYINNFPILCVSRRCLTKRAETIKTEIRINGNLIVCVAVVIVIAVVIVA